MPGPGTDWTGPGTGHQAPSIGTWSPVTSHRSYHLPGIGDRPVPDFYPEMGYGTVRDGTYDTGCYKHPQSVMPTTRGVQSHRDFQTPGLNDTRTFREEPSYGPQDPEYWRTYTPGDGRMSIRPGVPPSQWGAPSTQSTTGVDRRGSTSYTTRGLNPDSRKRSHETAFTESVPKQPPAPSSTSDSQSENSGTSAQSKDKSADLSGDYESDDHQLLHPTPAPPAQSVLQTSELSSETSEPSYFRKAINEVYRILPRDVCRDGSLTRPRAVRPTGSLGMLEQNEEVEDFVVLPHSVCVGKTLDFLEDQTQESRSLRGFQTSASDVKKLTGFGTYKAHSRFWPSEAPPLDACATDTDIKEPQTISVKGEVFKKWESRLRGLADCLSYMELFNAANFLQTQSRTQMPDVPSALLLRAQARASEQAIAGQSPSRQTCCRSAEMRP